MCRQKEGVDKCAGRKRVLIVLGQGNWQEKTNVPNIHTYKIQGLARCIGDVNCICVGLEAVVTPSKCSSIAYVRAF